MFAFNYDLRLILVRPNPMRIGIGMILLLAASAELPAADWVRVTRSPRFIMEVDAASLRSRGQYTEAQFRFDYQSSQQDPKTGARYLSAIVTLLFDCSHKKYAPFRRLEFSGHQAGGVTTGSIVRPDKEIRFVDSRADTINAKMLEYVCSHTTRTK